MTLSSPQYLMTANLLYIFYVLIYEKKKIDFLKIVDREESLTSWVHLSTKTRHALVLPTRTYIRLRVMNRQISEQNRRFFSNKSV